MLGSRTLGWNSPILALFDTGETIFCCCFCLLLSHSLVSQSLSCDISCQMLYRFPLLFPLPVHTLAVYLHQRPAPLPTGVLPPPPPPRPYCGGRRGGARPEKNDGLLHQEESTAFQLGDDDIGDENDSTLKNYCNPVLKLEPHPTYKSPERRKVRKVGRSWHT